MTESLHLLIEPKLHDLGDGLVVRRMLPSVQRRTVGPFVFFDHIGPVELAPGRGVDVRPHPHIGLSTMTYLFDGVFTHRDSLGVVQDIRPGAVNWMTAGRGVVHSERTPEPERTDGHRMHGVQFWVGLPKRMPNMIRSSRITRSKIFRNGRTMAAVFIADSSPATLSAACHRFRFFHCCFAWISTCTRVRN